MATTVTQARKAITTTGTAVALASAQEVLNLFIQADGLNSHAIHIGSSTVTTGDTSTRGSFLVPGEMSPNLGPCDLAEVYINGEAEDAVTYYANYGTSTSGITVVQPTATNLHVEAEQTTASELNATVVQGTASNLKVEPTQTTAANLKATVYQDTAASLLVTSTQYSQAKTYRERMTDLGYSWVENFLIDVGNDLTDDIDTTYTSLSKIDVHTRTGSNTLALVNTTGFTGDMYTVYWIECTKAGAMGTAEFKWRTRGFMGGAAGWGDYTTGVVTAANNDLGDNVVINFTGITSVVGDIYLVHGKPSWHTPVDGYNSYLTSFGVRTYDSSKQAKVAYARLSKNTWEVWEHLESSYVATAWRTPMIIHGNGTKQYRMEFKEATKGDLEYVYMEMKGWDEPE